MAVISKLLAVVTALAIVTEALPPPYAHTHTLHERTQPRSPWIKRARVEPDALIPVKIGLKQQNLHTGSDELLAVSDPKSPKYAQHWTGEEVNNAFAPHDDTVSAVRDWLVESGISVDRLTQSVNKGWISFQATAAEAENLFKTELYEHEHLSSGKHAVGCDEYHLPRGVSQHIDYATPLVKKTQLKKRSVPKRSKRSVSHKRHPNQSRNHRKPGLKIDTAFEPKDLYFNPSTANSDYGDLSYCNSWISPACIAGLYEIPEPSNMSQPGNAMGIFEEGVYYSSVDLNMFFANTSLFANNNTYIPQGTLPTLDSIDGGLGEVPVDQAGGEAELDLQLAYPIVYPQEIIVYSVDDVPNASEEIFTLGFGNTFLDALDGSYCNYSAFGETGDSPQYDPTYPDPAPGGYKGQLMCGTYKPTNVISISYGIQEEDVSPNYLERQCNELMKLSLQGVSILVASGDTGVAGYAGDPNATAADGCIGPNGTVFNPTAFNSCPYVTNVGATMLPQNGSLNITPLESAAWGIFGDGSLFTSSGGFSNVFGTPDYQKQAVANFFATSNPPYPSYAITGGYNASTAGPGVYNRIGRGIPDVAAIGMWITTYVAGEVARYGGTSASTPIFAGIINRINEERLAAGKNVTGFLNPSLYANPGMLNDIVNGTNPGCGTAGFSAVKGWDPVTGLGTPNYPKMLEYYMSLP